MGHKPTYAVVGAGFSGMVVAIQLLKRLRGTACVCLINRSLSFGRGLAYGTNSPSHLLNVPAGRMGIEPGHESGFIEYLQSRRMPYSASDFVPRSLYGDYLEHSLLAAQTGADKDVRLEIIEDEVVAIDPVSSEVGLQILRLSSGVVINATQVVLALGNFLPRPPATAHYADWTTLPLINDVWSHGQLERLPRDASVLLIGTGLTAYDAVLRLLDQGHLGPISMLSRRGLLPQPHREQEVPPASGIVPADFLLGESSVRQHLRRVRALIRHACASGNHWRDVIGGLRSHTPRLWQQLGLGARQQFLRHLLPYWDTHRHRAAPAIFNRVQLAIQRGQLQVLAGRLMDIDVKNANCANVRWKARGTTQSTITSYAAVVNCTGPSSDLKRVSDPLIVQLLKHGMLAVDAQDLGLRVDGSYRIIQHDGQVLAAVRYVGPLLKAQFWEATAVPELRSHAVRLVDAMLGPRI
jgi:uncharacterized NAD(P)/FAD-binding protein YdhS